MAHKQVLFRSAAREKILRGAAQPGAIPPVYSGRIFFPVTPQGRGDGKVIQSRQESGYAANALGMVPRIATKVSVVKPLKLLCRALE